MKNETNIISKTFLDFDNDPYVWDKVDVLLAEAEANTNNTVSFEEFFDRTNKFRLNL